MSKEIEKYFIKRLQTYLLEYLQDFSQNNMAKFSLGISSHIVLKNLAIKKQALLNFKFPLYILEGKINSISINMPLNYKKQQPEMIIEGLDILVCTIQEVNIQTKEHHSQGIENLKKHKLKLWEEQMNKYFEKLSPPNWIQKIVDGIFNNLSIQIKSGNIRLFSQQLMKKEVILRIKFDAFIKATDKDFKQNFNEDQNNVYRLIELKKISITFKETIKDITNHQKGKKDEQFLLFPVDIEIRHVKNLVCDQQDQPIQNISIQINNPIIFQITKDVETYLEKLNKLFQKQEIIQDNFHLRPKKQPGEEPGEWWKYMISSIIQQKKSQKLDIAYSSKKVVSMKRYIELYKRKQTIILVPWLQSWTAQDDSKFQECEESLPLKDLLKYREWAFQEIRIEAKRYYNSSKDGGYRNKLESANQHFQSVKPLIEIWTKTINNQESFRDNKQRIDDIPIELEDDEKINLYEILERDKTNVLSSYLKGENNHPDQIKMKFTLQIHSIFVLFVENNCQNNIKYIPKNTNIFQGCKCRYDMNLNKKGSQQRKSRNSKHLNIIQKSSINEINKDSCEQLIQSAKESESFYQDLLDLNENSSFISQQSMSDEKDDDIISQEKIETQSNNRLFLICCFVGIKIPLKILQNNSIQTLNSEKSDQIYIGNILILAPGMIPKLMEDNKENEDTKKLKIQTNYRLRKKLVKYQEFFNEIYDITTNKDSQQFLNSELCYQTLMEFLKLNKMIGIKQFLDDFERDKNELQDFGQEQFKQYDKYFDDTPEEEDQFFLHLVTKTQQKQNQVPTEYWKLIKNVTIHSEKKNNQWSELEISSKHNYIQKIHSRILEIIKKHLFVPLLEEYGDIILPLCIQNLKDKLTFPSQNLDEAYQPYCLQISLNIKGEYSDYKIINQSEIKKSQHKDKLIDSQSEIKSQLTQFQFLLTTKSISSLLKIFQKEDISLYDNQIQQYKQDYKLLECVLKSKPLKQYSIKQSKTKYLLKNDEKFKIQILSDQLYNKIRTICKFQLKQIIISSFDLNDFDDKNKDFVQYFNSESRNQEFKNLKDQYQYYNFTKLICQSIKITHKLFKLDQIQKQHDIQNEQLNQQNNSNKNQKQSASIKHSQSIMVDFKLQFNKSEPVSQEGNRNLQQQQQIKKDIKNKQVIMFAQIYAYKLTSLIQNHPLLTDNKYFISIPTLNIKVNESYTCLIETFMIINKYLQQDNKQSQKFQQLGRESLMRAEFVALHEEHKKQGNDCKHCIIKFKKSISLLNLIIGNIQKEKKHINIFQLLQFENSINLTQNMFKEGNEIMKNKKSGSFISARKKKNNNNGIKISFISTSKNNSQFKYITLIDFPFISFTQDKGYFKNTIIIHCTKTKDEIQVNQEKSRNQSQRALDAQKGDQKYSQSDRQFDLEGKGKIKTYINFIPKLKLEEKDKELEQGELFQKLDEKLLFYCRRKENELFNPDQDFSNLDDKKHREQILLLDGFNSQNIQQSTIYLLCYIHQPLRTHILNCLDDKQIEDQNQKSDKMKIFFGVEEINANFLNTLASYTIVNVITKIQFVKNIQQKAFDLIYGDIQKNNKQLPIFQQSPLKLLDQMIICIILQSLSLQSNQSSLLINNFKIFVQLNLMSKKIVYQNQQIQRTYTSYKGDKMNFSTFNNRSSIVSPPEENPQIMRCDLIKFSFNSQPFSSISQTEIKLINVIKIKDSLRLSVDDIQINIQGKKKESILLMPGKDNSAQRVTVALNIYLSFQSLNNSPQVKIMVEQAKLFLSQQKIQDLLIALNSYYLIHIEEQVSLKQNLRNSIFNQELIIENKKDPINIFYLTNNSLKKNEESQFTLDLTIDSLQIKLQTQLNQDNYDFLFIFHSIIIRKRLNQGLYMSIHSAGIEPQIDKGQNLVYPKLVEQKLPLSPNSSSEMRPIFKLENQFITLENLKFIYISKYINQLLNFKEGIMKIMKNNIEQLKDTYKTDYDLQLQIKQKEDFLKDENSLNYQIQIKDSELIVPEGAHEQSKVLLIFQQTEFQISKKNISIISPNNLQNENGNFQNDESIHQHDLENFKTYQISGNLEDVTVIYEIFHKDQTNKLQKSSGQLLQSNEIKLQINLSSFQQEFETIPYSFQSQCLIEVESLDMEMDFGKLERVKQICLNNNSEVINEAIKEDKNLLQQLQKIQIQLIIGQSSFRVKNFRKSKDKLKHENETKYQPLLLNETY